MSDNPKLTKPNKTQDKRSAEWVDRLKQNNGRRLVVDLDAFTVDELTELVEAGYGSSPTSKRRPTMADAVRKAIHDARGKIIKNS